MRSTFMGLETARRGMFTQQSALYTTGHNIANANTPGYSRQRVNFVQTTPYPSIGMNKPQMPGQMGTGVMAGTIERIRESFLDVQFQNESNKLGYWESKAVSLDKMEDIMNEPSNNSLAAVMGEFWQSLQDLSVHPEDDGARSVVIERGQSVADTFKYLSESLNQIKSDFGNEISVNIKAVNSLLKQIADVNEQISQVEPHGYLPNDLYDERDRLVDELSQFVNIKVEKKPSGGNALDIAEGSYTIKMVGADGSEFFLVNGSDYNNIGIKSDKPAIDTDQDGIPDKPDGKITGFTVYDVPKSNEPTKPPVPVYDVPFVAGSEVVFSQGKLKGLVESYGYDVGGTEKGIYPDMIENLDKLAYSFVSLFNEVHKKGYDLDGAGGKDFFVPLPAGGHKDAAKNIKLSGITTRELAVSSIPGDGGDGKNAINLSNIQGFVLSDGTVKLEGVSDLDIASLNLPIKTGTVNSFYEGMTGRLGVESQQAKRLAGNSELLLISVDERRQSVSAVSLDEEFTNMIKYQHAYNASARNITIVDEMLDKIINGMGVSGR
ncbi:flagellar hook-associated protein FlgK [Cytobacillus dafuensis]|uniref:Flagellar hook-associated protein 1 n=1 Tax=Cytobacillus dafuensis TaxID=1742359 RepID=A0A5B8Z9K1_CYTDA|nr:flagellar hook-associated protein FlgK [Cytobacillus dafuensis]QED49601.1 flagellar hook-associated protein FlgK [Cytobacillus dafuensis]